jgi:hypothetical protein
MEILIGIGIFIFLMLFAIERHLDGILKEKRTAERPARFGMAR